MNIIRILDSSIGQKIVAGATGLALVGFLVAHMGGNLQVFAGADALNSYAALLKSQAIVLWGARLGLLSLIVLHIAMTVRQVRRNGGRATRRYAQTRYQRTTLSSRTMMVTGLVVLGFVIFHLLHFTVGWILPEAYHRLDAEGRHDVYGMVVAGFQNPLIAFLYVIGMFSLVTHLKHAISSAWQTLGLARDGHDSVLRKFSPAIAFLIIAGFLAVPLSIAFGLVGS